VEAQKGEEEEWGLDSDVPGESVEETSARGCRWSWVWMVGSGEVDVGVRWWGEGCRPVGGSLLLVHVGSRFSIVD